MALQTLVGEDALEFIQTIYDETITLFSHVADAYGGRLRSKKDEDYDADWEDEYGPLHLVSNVENDKARVYIGLTDYGPAYDTIKVKTKDTVTFTINIKFGWNTDGRRLSSQLGEINEIIANINGLTQGLKLRLSSILWAGRSVIKNFWARVLDVSLSISGTKVENIRPVISIKLNIYKE